MSSKQNELDTYIAQFSMNFTLTDQFLINYTYNTDQFLVNYTCNTDQFLVNYTYQHWSVPGKLHLHWSVPGKLH